MALFNFRSSMLLWPCPAAVNFILLSTVCLLSVSFCHQVLLVGQFVCLILLLVLINAMTIISQITSFSFYLMTKLIWVSIWLIQLFRIKKKQESLYIKNKNHLFTSKQDIQKEYVNVETKGKSYKPWNACIKYSKRMAKSIWRHLLMIY